MPFRSRNSLLVVNSGFNHARVLRRLLTILARNEVMSRTQSAVRNKEISTEMIDWKLFLYAIFHSLKEQLFSVMEL